MAEESDGLRTKLEELDRHYAETAEQMNDPAVASDPRRIVALAKERELVVTPDRTFDWPDSAGHLHLLQRVRDEAHRFAVQYHQTLRDDVSTVLESIDGVGPALRKRLLRRFGSVEGVRGASVDELESVPGVEPATAERLRSRL